MGKRAKTKLEVHWGLAGGVKRTKMNICNIKMARVRLPIHVSIHPHIWTQNKMQLPKYLPKLRALETHV